MSNVLIKCEKLVKSYGHHTVVKEVDLIVEKREVLAIIGPNGAGKSTLLDLVLGLRKPDSGTVHYWSNNPNRYIGLQLQSTPFFPGFNALENLRMFAAFYGVRIKDEQLLKLLSQCGLCEVARTDAARLSGGQQKRLAIAMTLVHNPQLIFLDEPTAALDPRARREIRDLIRSLAISDTTVVFTSHDMEEVQKLATRIIMISNGIIQASGTTEELMTEHHVSSVEELYIKLTENESST